jgi:site-specific recombinase XerD
MADQKKLTKRVIDCLKADPEGRDVTYFDAEIRGFGVRVKPSGAKSYVLKYRNRFGQQRKFHIARVGDITPEQARDKATKLRGRIADGKDPVNDRNSERNAVTVAQLCDEYLDAEKGRIKASTLAMDKSRINRHVKPLLGSKAVAGLTPADMEKFLRDVMAGKSVKAAPKTAATEGMAKRPRGGIATGGSAVASRTLGMLGTILERAVRDGVLAKNPVRGIARPKDNERKPPFTFDTIATLGKTMRESEEEGENEIGIRALRFLLLTGCRRMEALTLQWSTVDRQNRCLRFRDTKSGAQIRPVGRAALDLLASFEPKTAKPIDYVFPGASKQGNFIGLPRVWARTCKRAGIEDVSIHGLRHWFASVATAMGYSELVIAGLLGHRVKGVTARYATAPDSALLAAADAVASSIANHLDDGTQADATVLPFPILVSVP